MESVIVGALLVTAACYLTWRGWRWWRVKRGACACCPLMRGLCADKEADGGKACSRPSG